MPQWLIFALLSTLFAGITAVIAKYGLKDVSADLGLAVRTVVVFFVITLNFLFFHSWREVQTLNWKITGFFALSGLTAAFSWIFYYRAIKIGTVSEVALIDKGSILITLLLSFWLLREPVTPRVLIGAGLIVGGIVVLAWK